MNAHNEQHDPASPVVKQNLTTQPAAAQETLLDELGVKALAWKERAEVSESEVKVLQRRVEILERLKTAQSVDMANSVESALRSTARAEMYRAKLNELLNAAPVTAAPGIDLTPFREPVEYFRDAFAAQSLGPDSWHAVKVAEANRLLAMIDASPTTAM